MDSASERTRLLQRDAEWAAAASEGRDLERVLSYWTDDAIVFAPGLPAVVGKDALFPFLLSAAPTPEWVALFNREWSMRSVPQRAASVHGDILVLECAIEELHLLAENLEVDMTTANRQYRERLLRQGVHEQQGGYEEQQRERTDDDTAIGEALGKLKKR